MSWIYSAPVAVKNLTTGVHFYRMLSPPEPLNDPRNRSITFLALQMCWLIQFFRRLGTGFCVFGPCGARWIAASTGQLRVHHFRSGKFTRRSIPHISPCRPTPSAFRRLGAFPTVGQPQKPKR